MGGKKKALLSISLKYYDLNIKSFTSAKSTVIWALNAFGCCLDDLDLWSI